MLYKNLTAKELFATMAHTQDVADLFEKGIESNNDRLAGSAMEELLRRGDTDLIAYVLDKFFEDDTFPIRAKEFLFVIMRDLEDSCKEIDPMLCKYAEEGWIFGPTKWVQDNAETFRAAYRSGLIKRAGLWAQRYLCPEAELAASAADIEILLDQMSEAEQAKTRRHILADRSFVEWYKNNFGEK